MMRRFKPVRIAGICAGLVMVVAGVLGFSASAYAETTTETFKSTGAEQTFVVPSGVTSVHVLAVGGAGGAGGHYGTPVGGAGGRGAVVSGDLAVTPGDTLYVEVG
jgi:hypothetical protein